MLKSFCGVKTVEMKGGIGQVGFFADQGWKVGLWGAANVPECEGLVRVMGSFCVKWVNILKK